METVWALLLSGANAFVAVVGFTASAIVALAVLVLLWKLISAIFGFSDDFQ